MGVTRYDHDNRRLLKISSHCTDSGMGKVNIENHRGMRGLVEHVGSRIPAAESRDTTRQFSEALRNQGRTGLGSWAHDFRPI